MIGKNGGGEGKTINGGSALKKHVCRSATWTNRKRNRGIANKRREGGMARKEKGTQKVKGLSETILSGKQNSWGGTIAR